LDDGEVAAHLHLGGTGRHEGGQSDQQERRHPPSLKRGPEDFPARGGQCHEGAVADGQHDQPTSQENPGQPGPRRATQGQDEHQRGDRDVHHRVGDGNDPRRPRLRPVQHHRPEHSCPAHEQHPGCDEQPIGQHPHTRHPRQPNTGEHQQRPGGGHRITEETGIGDRGERIGMSASKSVVSPQRPRCCPHEHANSQQRPAACLHPPTPRSTHTSQASDQRSQHVGAVADVLRDGTARQQL